MRIDLYHHIDSGILTRIEAGINELLKRNTTIMATLDDLVQAASDETSVDDSIVALVTALKASVDAALGGALTPAQQTKVDQVFTTITGNSKKVADAVLANTPEATA